MSDRLPKALLEKQEAERRQTIEKVIRAVHDLRVEGSRLNIKNLMAYTGLSRSVFAKPHVRTILEEHGIVISKSNLSHKSRDMKIVKDKKSKDGQRIQLLMKENEELRRECELLRGHLFLLMQGQQK